MDDGCDLESSARFDSLAVRAGHIQGQLGAQRILRHRSWTVAEER